MAFEDLDTDLEIACRKLDDAERRVELASQRIANARTPIGRITGNLALWSSVGDAKDSAEHVDMIEQLKAFENSMNGQHLAGEGDF